MNHKQTPRVTAVFLLYNAEQTVPNLIRSIWKQQSKQHLHQGHWLEALFMNDCSSDSTKEVLESELLKIGNPSHYRVHHNKENQGLAGTLNIALQQVTTPYALTCHCDVVFGSDDYVAGLLELIQQQPNTAIITGKPAIQPRIKVPFAEKLNLVSNLMDIFPPNPGDSKLIPIEFAEGRCDIFQMEALKKVGFYSLKLRTSGEDQLLAAQLRKAGYRLYQAPNSTYFLSVSNEQNTVLKLAKHQRLFGKTHPFILVSHKEIAISSFSAELNANLKLRKFLRVHQLLSGAVYAATFYYLLLGRPQISLILVSIILLVKYQLFRKHLNEVKLTHFELTQFFLVQPLFDIYYCAGFVQGIIAIIT